jgi:ATP-dependent Lon protease
VCIVSYRITIYPGNGKLSLSGLGSSASTKEPVRIAFDYFKANVGRVSASAKVNDHDFHLSVLELNNTGPTDQMTLPAFVALCSVLMSRPIQSQMVVLGSMSLGGNVVPVQNLAESMQAAFDAGAKRILIPMSSVSAIATVPGELFSKFQTSFYSDPVDAVFKALGVD